MAYTQCCCQGPEVRRQGQGLKAREEGQGLQVRGQSQLQGLK